jgi:diguanylate cyclase (GGDEF)-like protein/PAS domain S-box-containing protein
MKPKRLRSIKTRVTLFTLATFLISILALAIYGRGILHVAVQGLLGEQQLSAATLIAASVSQEVDERRTALEAVAAALTPAVLDDPRALQALFARKEGWPAQFLAGAFVVRADGLTTVAIPARPVRPPVRFADSEFINSALRDGKTGLGQMNRGAPGLAIGMAVPLRDAQGQVFGALVAVTDLGQSGFLKQFALNSDRQAGNYLLVSGQQRRVLAGSDSNAIMETLSAGAPGGGVIDEFMRGHEGSGIAVNSRGERLLASSRSIAPTDWQVLVTLPIDDAFSPLRAARKHMLLATIIMGLLASGAIWLILRRELTPMLDTVKTLARLSATNQPPPPLAIPNQGEIAELIGAFNRLLATLGQREEALRVAEPELRIAAAAFESQEGMIVTDAKGTILRVNKAFTETTGYSADEAVGQTPNLLKSGFHDADFYREMWRSIRRSGGWQGEIWDRRKNGEVYPKWLTISVVKDENGAVTHYVGAHFDITERKRQESLVHQLAFYDPLTKLPNRRLLGDRLSQTLAAGKRSGCHGALMFIDLDNFKSLNDTCGHIAGDLLLVEVANRLRGCVREVDTVARFGGDEFVVLLSELSADRAESTSHSRIVAEKIRAALCAPYHLMISRESKTATPCEHHCSASIGAIVLAGDGASADDLFKWADAAMYRAKAAGRNLIRFHDSEPTDKPAKHDAAPIPRTAETESASRVAPMAHSPLRQEA